MLSYPIPEAEELLTNKLSAAQQSLRNCEEDLDFLREQVTVRCVLNRTSPKQPGFARNRLGELLPFPLLLFPFPMADYSPLPTDNGSCHRARIQLGHLAEAQGGEGGWKRLDAAK
jgi:hypothetical protein